MTAVAQLRRNRTIIPIALTAAVLLASFVAGLRGGVATSLSFLDIDITALTAAISSNKQGLVGHPYQGYEAVRNALRENGLTNQEANHRDNFRDYENITEALRAAANSDVCGSPLISQIFNDQGLIEFFHAAFWIFGVDVKSLYYFYFALLVSSIVIYLVVFWRDYAACALIFACAAAVFPFMSGFLFEQNQLISISSPRFLSTLGIIPLLYILLTFFAANSTSIRWTTLIALLLQSALLSFAIAIRSSSLWMEIAFGLAVIACIASAIVQWKRRGDRLMLQTLLLSRGAIALYVIAALFLCSSGRLFFALPNCGIGLGMHSFWHDIFIGFAEHPGSQSEFGFDHEITGDAISGEAAKRYAEENHLPYQTEPDIYVATRSSRLLGVDGVPFGSWQTYEHVMRSVVLDFVRRHPRYTLETFLIFKPLNLIHSLEQFFTIALKGLFGFEGVFLLVTIFAVGYFAPESAFVRGVKPIPRNTIKTIALTAAITAVIIITIIIFAYRYVTSGQEAVLIILFPILVIGFGCAVAPPSMTNFDGGLSHLKFQHIISIVAFCILVSTVPLIVVLTGTHLISDPAFLVMASILFCLIWLVSLERSMARRRAQLNGD
jgi:hypothetical protein